MNDPVETTFGAGAPWGRRVRIGVLLFTGFTGVVLCTLLGVTMVPPVLGKIVDARTGRLAGGMVCEGMEYAG